MMVDVMVEVEVEIYGGKVELIWMVDKKLVVYVGIDFCYIGRDGEWICLMKRNMMMGEELMIFMWMVDEIW